MTRQKKADDDDQIAPLSIRLPVALKSKIKERAQTNRRSLNQEVVWLIELALKELQESSSTNEQLSH